MQNRDERRTTNDRQRQRERSRPTDVPGNAMARRDTTDSYAHPKLSGSWRTARTCRSAGRCACPYEGSRLPATAVLVYPSGMVRRWEKSVPRTPRTTAPKVVETSCNFELSFSPLCTPAPPPMICQFYRVVCLVWFIVFFFPPLRSDDLFRRIAIFVTRREGGKTRRKSAKFSCNVLLVYTGNVCFERMSFDSVVRRNEFSVRQIDEWRECCWHNRFLHIE